MNALSQILMQIRSILVLANPPDLANSNLYFFHLLLVFAEFLSQLSRLNL